MRGRELLLAGRQVRLREEVVCRPRALVRDPARWVRRSRRLREVRQPERRLRRRLVQVPAKVVHRSGRAVRNRPGRVRRSVHLRDVRGPDAVLRRRRTEQVRSDRVRAEDVSVGGQELRDDQRRLREHPDLRDDVPGRSDLRRGRGGERVRLHPHDDLRRAGQELREDPRRLRRGAGLRGMHRARLVRRKRDGQRLRLHVDGRILQRVLRDGRRQLRPRLHP